MNKNIIEGNWEIIKGKFESQWGKLTDDPSTEALGDMNQLKGYLQKQYGWTEEEAKEEFHKVERMRDAIEEEERGFDDARAEEDNAVEQAINRASKKIDDIFK